MRSASAALNASDSLILGSLAMADSDVVQKVGLAKVARDLLSGANDAEPRSARCCSRAAVKMAGSARSVRAEVSSLENWKDRDAGGAGRTDRVGSTDSADTA